MRLLVMIHNVRQSLENRKMLIWMTLMMDKKDLMKKRASMQMAQDPPKRRSRKDSGVQNIHLAT